MATVTCDRALVAENSVHTFLYDERGVELAADEGRQGADGAVAAGRKCTTAQLPRQLLIEADTGEDAPPPLVDRDELLRLLSEKAPSGHHGAMVTPSHLLGAESDDAAESEDDPFWELDQLAPRRESRRGA